MGANTRIFWITQQSKPPRGTKRLCLAPTSVKAGDYVLLSGTYWKIRSMTSLTAGGRLLHFEGRTPHVMRVPMDIHRPQSL